MPVNDRIIGPNHNRLLIITARPRGEATPPGVVLPRVAQMLLNAGWDFYEGPATARRGWVVPGTDPALRPRTHEHS